MLRPAIQGTRVACEAAKQCGSVKKLVIMSSFAAVYDAALGLQPGKVYTEEDWSPLGYAEGRDTDNVVSLCFHVVDGGCWLLTRG